MTFSATVTKVYEGPRNVIYRLTGKSDGSGQETNVLKVDVATFTPRVAGVKVMRIQGTVQGGSVELLWDAPTPARFAELSGQVQLNDRWFGGEVNRTAGKSGDILLSTIGFASGSVYDLTVDMVKKA